VTTKLPGARHGYDEALASFERSRTLDRGARTGGDPETTEYL
jgi:hypothetical protein